MSVLDQKSYLAGIPPFDRLSDLDLDRVARSLDIGYFNEGETIIAAGSVPEYQYLVIKGLVQEADADGPVNYFGEQDNFDARVLLHGKADTDFLAVDEVICYLLPKHVFLEIARQNQMFAEFYFTGISQRLKALLERDENQKLASFMMARIRDAYIHPKIIVDASTSIRESALTMERRKATALLVRRGDKVGIVTDVDFRKRVVIDRIPADEEIGKIANYQVVCMEAGDFLFNAMLTMTRHSIRRVVIRHQEEYIGVLEELDLLSYFSDHSHLIAVQIARAETQEGLARANARIPDLVRALMAKGVKWRHSTQLVTELSRQIFAKLYELLAPPELIANSCLVVLGSEGRGEQILHTDQDNALILRDGFDFPDLQRVAERFKQALNDMGYPDCPGNIMVTNPQWAKSLRAFKDTLYSWLVNSEPEDFMNLSIFADATAVAGDAALLQEAKTYLHDHIADRSSLYPSLAKAAVSFETPLNFFDDFIVQESDGVAELDIKKGGVFPVVHGVRTLALQFRVAQTNTIERIRAIQRLGILNHSVSIDLIEAFAFLSALRVKAGLEEIYRGKDVDNLLSPASLNKLERDLLRDSLKIVKHFKAFLTKHFHLNLVT